VVASGKSFKATFASASRAGGYATGEAADPIVAMVRALTSAPLVRRAPACGKSTALPTVVDDPALG
jgi:hypothetical protein